MNITDFPNETETNDGSMRLTETEKLSEFQHITPRSVDEPQDMPNFDLSSSLASN